MPYRWAQTLPSQFRLPGGEPAAVILPQGLVAFHRHGLGGEEVPGSGAPWPVGKALVALSTYCTSTALKVSRAEVTMPLSMRWCSLSR